MLSIRLITASRRRAVSCLLYWSTETALPDDTFVSIDITKVSMDIPSDIQRLIGHGILEFSKLETITEHILSDLLNLEYEDTQLIISQLDASRKFQILKSIIERRFPEAKDIKPKDSIWRAITVLNDARNTVAHGNWIMVGDTPFILSHRWKGPRGMVMAEPFPYERLRRVGRLSKNLTDRFKELSRALEMQRATSSPQPPTAAPSPETGRT